MDEEKQARDSSENRTGGTDVFRIPDTAETFRLEPDTIINLHRLARFFEKMNLDEYFTYLRAPHRVLWSNLIAGIARGLGFAFGMTILFGLMLYALGRMVDLPLIGKYVAKIVAIVQEEMRLSK